MNKILVVSFLFLLSGCVAAPVVLTGLGVASVATNETTGKSLTDHAVSTATQQDCRIARTIRDQPICQDPALTQLQITTTGTKPSTVAEIESRYRQ
jgi:starvation-inducible outer membrane lipoprotein